ncbi:MAG TPA: NAD-dependent epimerase/dehydratase family protein [Candidatus Obscuribacterales bacterium]
MSVADGSSSSMADPKVLVTGATGLVGRALVAKLLAQGLPVRAQVRSAALFCDTAGGAWQNVEVKEADFAVAEKRDLAALVQGCSAVVHTAALVHDPDAAVADFERINVRATRELAEAAAQTGVESFVFLSTIGVYGQGPLENVREDAPIKPVTAYAVSKAKSEDWLLSAGLFERTVVLRPSLVFGEGDRGNLIKLIRQIKSGKYVHVDAGLTSKSLIYSGDLARAICLSLADLPGGRHVYNIANPDAVSLTALVTTIARCLGRRCQFVTLPKPLVMRVARLAHLMLGKRSPVTAEQIDRLVTTATCCVEKFVAATGFRPQYTLPEALAAEIAWGQSTGLL